MATRRRLPLVFLIPALAALVALPACGGEAETETVRETVTETETVTVVETETVPAEPPTDGEPTLANSCENPDDGYVVRYPEGWFSNPGEVAAACSYFHPQRFQVPEQTEVWDIAVSISREPAAFGDVAGDDPTIDIVTSEETEVDGRRAIVRETEATGDGLLPAGVGGYQYLVDLDGETLVLSTYDVEELDFERNRTVLDEMAATLDIDR